MLTREETTELFTELRSIERGLWGHYIKYNWMSTRGIVRDILGEPITKPNGETRDVITRLLWHDTGRGGLRACCVKNKIGSPLRIFEIRALISENNQGLVGSIAKRYLRHIDFEDARQEGNIGLIKAIDRFDVSRGFRFVTYAPYWIRHTIGRAVDNTSRTIRVSIWTAQRVREISRVQEKLSGLLKRDVSLNEASEATDVPIMPVLLHLEDPVGRFDLLLQDVIPGDTPDGEAQVAGVEASSLLRDALDKLAPRLRHILIKRFFEGQSLNTVGAGMTPPLSRERVRQLETEGMSRLRGVIKWSGISHTEMLEALSEARHY